MEEPGPKRPRFAFSSESQKCGLVSDAVPPNTKKVTNTWVSVLQEYVKAKGLEPIQFDAVFPEKLASLLEGFYADARTRFG